jgi:hypothetical protein
MNTILQQKAQGVLAPPRRTGGFPYFGQLKNPADYAKINRRHPGMKEQSPERYISNEDFETLI